MLAPESSPVYQLVAPWWTSRQRPETKLIPSLREDLTAAALEELREHVRQNLYYCPFSDHRALWFAAWLDRAQNPFRYRIDPDLTARAAFVFDRPLSPCGKDRAVGST